MNEPVKKIQQLLSDEVQEIINYKPRWFIRKGNFIFLLVILLLLLLAFVIQYPDTIKTSVRFSAINAPKMIETKTGGILEKLLVRNGQNVKKGEPLAYIHSTGNHSQLRQLQKWIAEMEPEMEAGKLEGIDSRPLPVFTDLGELQTSFQDFQSSFRETRQVLGNGYYQKKKNALEKDLQYISALKNNTWQQQQLIIKDQGLQKNEYEAYEKLAKEKVIAPLELNQYKSKLIAKEQSLSQTESQLTNSEISSNSKRKELLELQKTVMDQQQKLQSSFFTLKNQVAGWMQQYVLTAPENGRLEFVSFLQENQLLSNGQQLFFIQQSPDSYFGEMKAGQAGLGKIKDGQKVIIKLAGYPSSEFGHIEGKVSYISSLPNERDSFMVRVDLPNGLVTNYGKAIVFRNNLSASAEVITYNRRLIDRLFNQLNQSRKAK